MKKLLSIVCMVLLSVVAVAQKSKTIVVYFSVTGNTEKVAKQIAQEANAELLPITPDVAYTESDLDFRNPNCRSLAEMKDAKVRPAVKNVKDLKKYDTIYLGYPIWANEAPRVVNSFIEAAKLDGKKVIPFATAGSSPIDNSLNKLKETYPNIKWQDGKVLLSRTVKEDIKAFVQGK